MPEGQDHKQTFTVAGRNKISAAAEMVDRGVARVENN